MPTCQVEASGERRKVMANQLRSRATLMPSNDWRDYIDSAKRKLEIARYHRDCLERELASARLTGNKLPTIAIQAHFEGVVISLMAAVDQIAQATNSARNLRLPPTELVEKAFNVLGDAVPAINSWYKERIGVDLRRIRTRAVHYSYVKNATKDNWAVELLSQPPIETTADRGNCLPMRRRRWTMVSNLVSCFAISNRNWRVQEIETAAEMQAEPKRCISWRR